MDCPKRNALAGLPDEAMLEILARTPFRSVCRSKCVAKAWRDLIDDPLNRSRLPQTLQGFFSMFYPKCNSDGSSDLNHVFVKFLASPVPLDIDLDPCLSFLMKLPEIESLYFLDSCNGLLLFVHCQKSIPYEYDVLNYIVCNPATEHWGTVPVCARCPPRALSVVDTFLAFDPAVSSHFHLIQFFKGPWGGEEAPLAYEGIVPLAVHTYSSEIGVWSHSQTDWNQQDQLEAWRHRRIPNYGCHLQAFVNGILHLVVFEQDQHEIVAVDVQGKRKRIITIPAAAEGRCWCHTPYIGQSQGRLHYINQAYTHDSRQLQCFELSIWELQDYNTQEWVLKDTVSFLSLFGQEWVFNCIGSIVGRMSTCGRNFHIVVIHPDRNVVFFLEPLNRLIAYDMDCKEVSVVSMLSENLERDIVPYIPYFSESPALTNKN